MATKHKNEAVGQRIQIGPQELIIVAEFYRGIYETLQQAARQRNHPPRTTEN